MSFKIVKLFLFLYFLKLCSSLNYDYFIEDNEVYLISTTKLSWSDAHSTCKTKSMELISVTNYVIYERIVKYMKLYKMILFWTSGARVGGNFKWLAINKTLDEVGYSNWIPGFPSSGADNNYLNFHGEHNYLWSNNAITYKMEFGCVTDLESFIKKEKPKLSINCETNGNTFVFNSNVTLKI